jgi:outer membrane protein assembly factor BamB
MTGMGRSARWKCWLGGAAASVLLGACSSLPVYGTPELPSALSQAPYEVFSVDWWKQLVPPGLLEYAPRELAAPAYDAENDRVIALTRDGSVWSVAPGGEVAWRYKVGNRFYSGAAVHEGLVLVPGTDGVLYGLDARTGALRWKYEAGEALASVPVVSEGLVLVASQSDTVFAVKHESGELAWLYRRDAPTGFTIHRAAAPAVREGTAYAGFSDGVLVALDLSDGSVRWERSLAPGNSQFRDVDSTPVLDESGRLYVASYSGGLYALQAGTGEVLWNAAVQGLVALLVRGDVIIAVGDDRLEAYLGESGRLIWSRGLDKRAGHEPALVGGLLLVPAQRAMLFVDPRTGESRVRWDPGEGVSAPPRVAGSRVFVLSNNGFLYSLHLAKRGG